MWHAIDCELTCHQAYVGKKKKEKKESQCKETKRYQKGGRKAFASLSKMHYICS